MTTGRASIFEEQWVPGSDSRTQLWMGQARVAGTVQAELLLTHGLGEHASRYEHVAAALAGAGFRLHVYDLRGHGRSSGRRGDAPRYRALLEDLECVRARVECGPRPLFYLGHSLGGQITLSYLLARRPACHGAVIASPWLRLAFYPPRWRLALARAAARVWPSWLQRTPGLREVLSRDLTHLASLPAPELVHHRISARLYLAIEAAGREALARAGELTAPVLLLHGGDDQVTSAEATAQFFQRAGSADKTFQLYPEARHETHNDLGREQVLADVVAWLKARVAGPGAQ